MKLFEKKAIDFADYIANHTKPEMHSLIMNSYVAGMREFKNTMLDRCQNLPYIKISEIIELWEEDHERNSEDTKG